MRQSNSRDDKAMNPARRRTIDEMKASIADLMAVTEHHEEELLRVWGEAMGWIPCNQEGDV